MLAQREESALLIVDMQERLLPAMAERENLVKNARTLLAAAARLAVPVVVSEQYVKGLGPTVAPIREALPAGAAVMEKVSFSCLGDDALARHLAGLKRPQIIVAGIEAHVCVLQTAEQLLAAGHAVFVIADATSSRAPANHGAAMARLAGAGCIVATTEMVLFEWLQRAATPEFRELSLLVK